MAHSLLDGDPQFFATPADMRRWLKKNHATTSELWVGYYKVDSGKRSITWPESVDEALCYGWIDGIRKSIDQLSYKIRFTPRRPDSVWSDVNVKRIAVLDESGRMTAPGLAAFALRKEARSGVYSHEQPATELAAPYSDKLRANAKAWDYFNAQAKSYQKAVIWWVMSAKREETQLRRLAQLISDSEAGRRIAQFTSPVGRK